MNQNMNKENPDSATGEKPQAPVNIMVTLEGEEASRFLAYKRKEFLRANAEAGRKLMLERLAQVEGEAA